MSNQGVTYFVPFSYNCVFSMKKFRLFLHFSNNIYNIFRDPYAGKRRRNFLLNPICISSIRYLHLWLLQLISKLTIHRLSILRTADDSVGCLGDDYCPPQCNCAGSVVRCSRSQLTEIPRGIPPETTELYLDVNDIKTIQPERLNHLRILTRL